jgi:hypothetical protein
MLLPAVIGHTQSERKVEVPDQECDEGFLAFLDRPWRREAARGWHSLHRRERKELRPWSFMSALWAGDDGVVVIVHRHRYVRLPTLRTAASDGYDHIFSHIILQARNAPSDHLTTSARGQGATNKNFGIAANGGS